VLVEVFEINFEIIPCDSMGEKGVALSWNKFSSEALLTSAKVVVVDVVVDVVCVVDGFGWVRVREEYGEEVRSWTSFSSLPMSWATSIPISRRSLSPVELVSKSQTNSIAGL
jgi:hypothetical protein